MTPNPSYSIVAFARAFVLQYAAAALSLVGLKTLILVLFGRGVWVASLLDLALIALIVAVVISVVRCCLKGRDIS
ncbi:MAG: hypothetical protein HYY23_04375 [Verrucomicrobia bacterium]|nr:hypothetical protein [Verrucomicrobiota bacterium]